MSVRNSLQPYRSGVIAFVGLLLFAHPQLLAADEAAADGVEVGDDLKLLVGGVPQSGYWIGVDGRAIGREIAERLNLKADQGVILDEVMPDSPAAKAGLAKDDVILSVGDRPVTSIEELAAAIAGSQGNPIKLNIQRTGQAMSIDVTPAKRAAGPQVIVLGEKGEEGEEIDAAKERLEGLMRQLGKRVEKTREAAEGPRVIYRALSGQPGSSLTGDLPDDMDVTIQKRGHQPARVIVKQGEKMWKTTENELGMLPAESQAYVARVLGRPAVGAMGGFSKPIAPLSGQAQRFEFRLGEDGKAQLIKPEGGRESKIKVLPDGIRIEIEEEHDGKTPAKPPIKWHELKRPEPVKDTPEQKIRTLQDQVKQLRQQLEQLRKTDDSPKEKSE